MSIWVTAVNLRSGKVKYTIGRVASHVRGHRGRAREGWVRVSQRNRVGQDGSQRSRSGQGGTMKAWEWIGLTCVRGQG